MNGRHLLAALALSLCAPAALAWQTKEAAAPKAPALKAGDPAPAFQVEKWLKGTPVPAFEKDKIYVVEFWATWCGPCIAVFPHLSELQAKYKDKGVTVIGTNIWEDVRGKPPYDESTVGKIEKFVAEQGERMSYTVAYDGGTKSADASWMKAAGRGGIPSAFIVDRKSVVAWVGHPAAMDWALSEIVAGTWDPKAGPELEKKYGEQLKAIAGKSKTDKAGALADFEKFEAEAPSYASHQHQLKLNLLLGAEQWDRAYALLSKQVDTAIAAKDAMGLNEAAWMIVDPAATWKKRDVDLALKAALKAVEFTESKDAAILDTLARAHFWKGDVAKAIEIQTKAVELAKPPMKADLEKALAEYKAKNTQ